MFFERGKRWKWSAGSAGLRQGEERPEAANSRKSLISKIVSDNSATKSNAKCLRLKA
jgi:hypothetical protein